MPDKPEVQDLAWWRRRAIGYSQMAVNAEEELQRCETRCSIQTLMAFVVGMIIGCVIAAAAATR
jgi:hypothetical protein